MADTSEWKQSSTRMIFHGQLQQGERSRGGQRKQYKDELKANLTMLDINLAHLESPYCLHIRT